MKIKDILTGYKPLEPQMVGVMTCIPIVTDKPYEPVGNVGDLILERDVSYERLKFQNESENISIIPHGYTYFTKKESAQDRAVGRVYIVKEKQSIEVDADCLEPSEGGHMRPGEKEWSVLPLGLKLAAWEKAEDGDYQSLWPSIEKYLKNVGLKGNALITFFRAYKKELDEFVAQFEPVDKQVGAIVMFGDKVVGIELMPNYEFWREMWRPLIRDCYGSDAVGLVKKGLGLGYKPMVSGEDVETVDDLEAQVKHVYKKADDFAKQVVGDVLNQDISASEKQAVGDWTLYDIDSDAFKGQTVQHGPEHYIYLSSVYKGLENIEEFKREFAPIWEKQETYSKSEFKF